MCRGKKEKMFNGIFVEQMAKENNYTRTENSAVALRSTMSPLVDLFGTIGALRGKSDREIETAFSKAFSEDKTLALKMLFYARDIRGGLGERNTFRVIMQWMSVYYPEILAKNIEYVAEFGRWDDLFILFDSKLEKQFIEIIKNQIKEDYKAEYPTLLAKWMPSINTSSSKTRAMAKKFIKAFEVNEKQYRQMLSTIRKRIGVLETIMSNGEWDKIDYSKVPSRAMNVYRKAFYRHDEDGMNAYIESVKKGEKKINASTLFPYDLVEKYIEDDWSGLRIKQKDEVVEAQWNALPNYIKEGDNILIMADTSRSMSGRPLATSVGLAVYFAERNKGAYKDYFMTFSRVPRLVKLRGETLNEKLRNIEFIVENTNFESALKLVLNTAINNNCSQDDMPKALIVISDMQFDSANQYGNTASGRGNWTFYDKMAQMYADKGYQIPNVIFWNVAARGEAFQVTSDYKGVQLASGQSVGAFKGVLANIGYDPYEAMYNTLMVERYEKIKA